MWPFPIEYIGHHKANARALPQWIETFSTPKAYEEKEEEGAMHRHVNGVAFSLVVVLAPNFAPLALPKPSNALDAMIHSSMLHDDIPTGDPSFGQHKQDHPMTEHPSLNCNIWPIIMAKNPEPHIIYISTRERKGGLNSICCSWHTHVSYSYPLHRCSWTSTTIPHTPIWRALHQHHSKSFLRLHFFFLLPSCSHDLTNVCFSLSRLCIHHCLDFFTFFTLTLCTLTFHPSRLAVSVLFPFS